MAQSNLQSEGAKSVMSKDMQELTQGEEDMSHSVQGHKANLSNPNTSEKSKENSRQAIKEMGGDAAHYGDETNPRTDNAAEDLEGVGAKK